MRSNFLALKVIQLLLLFAFASACLNKNAYAQLPPIRLAIVGLVHGHALGLMEVLPRNKNVQLVGIAEPGTKVLPRHEYCYDANSRCR